MMNAPRNCATATGTEGSIALITCVIKRVITRVIKISIDKLAFLPLFYLVHLIDAQPSGFRPVIPKKAMARATKNVASLVSKALAPEQNHLRLHFAEQPAPLRLFSGSRTLIIKRTARPVSIADVATKNENKELTRSHVTRSTGYCTSTRSTSARY
jgi:hypothetical protein